MAVIAIACLAESTELCQVSVAGHQRNAAKPELVVAPGASGPIITVSFVWGWTDLRSFPPEQASEIF